MSSESTVQKQVWLGLASRKVGRATLFRTNSGKGWLSGGGKVVVDQNRTAHVPFARPVALGLAMVNGDTVPGLSDLTGFVSVRVTPDMVGRVLPVFATIETKESGGGRRKDNQINFVEQVKGHGGIAGFAASEAEAHEIIDAWLATQPLF